MHIWDRYPRERIRWISKRYPKDRLDMNIIDTQGERIDIIKRERKSQVVIECTWDKFDSVPGDMEVHPYSWVWGWLQQPWRLSK